MDTPSTILRAKKAATFETDSAKKTNLGEVPLDVPSDRNSTFDPIVILKHQHMSAKTEQVIITKYFRGMSTRDIEDTIKDIYWVEVSE